MKRIHIFGIAVLLLTLAEQTRAADSAAYRSESGVMADSAGVRKPDDGSKTGQDNSVPAIMERFVMGDAFSPDFEEGAFSWKGKRFNAGNARAFRARFERYLSTPLEEYQAERTYRETLAQIEDLLQVINAEKGVDKTYQAWTLLYDAAKFPPDADASILIANQVYNAWSVRNENDATLVEKAELERTRRAQERTVSYWSYSDEARERTQYEENLNRELKIQKMKLMQQVVSNNSGASSSSSSSTSGSSAKTATGSVKIKSGDNEFALNGTPGAQAQPGKQAAAAITQGMTDAAFRAADLTKTTAEIATIEASAVAANMRAKFEFQTQIVMLLMQRRFEHALIAIGFYQKIFKGSHQGLEVGKTQLSQFFQTADITPSMRTLETVAREAMNDTRTGMRAVDASYDAGDRWTALERLQETFALGEYSAEVNAFPTDKRRVLLDIYRDARDLQRVAELKDYGNVEAIVARLNKSAPDFPSTPVLSAVRSAQQGSNIALYAAKQAMLSGNTAEAQSNMKEAIALWPLNPAIKDFSESAADKLDLSTQAVPMFDQLLAQKNDRAIAAKAVEFGMALHQDPERSAQLKKTLERVSQVDIAIAYANEALAQRNPYAAWETLLNARAIDPDDPELARAMGRMAGQVGEYARILTDGERALKEGRTAGALALFLAGQDMYPASQICRIGVENASQALMQQQAGRPVDDSLLLLNRPNVSSANAPAN